MIARFDLPIHCAALSIDSGGTPVISADLREVPLLGGFRHGLESGGVVGDEFPVLKSIPQDYVQHSHQQGEIGSGTQRKIKIGIARDGRHPRIGHNELTAVIATAPYVVGGDGSAVADIGANNKEHLGFGNFAPGDSAAIYAKRQFVGCPGGDHAKSAVVIDVPRA